jgi:hypothetical protein
MAAAVNAHNTTTLRPLRTNISFPLDGEQTPWLSVAVSVLLLPIDLTQPVFEKRHDPYAFCS